MYPFGPTDPLGAWLARTRSLGTIRKMEAMLSRFTAPKIQALKDAEATFRKAQTDFDRMEREKHGWEEVEEPPEGAKPWE